MSKLFGRRTLTIGAFGVITIVLGLSIGRDIRQYTDNSKDNSKTPQESLAASSNTSFPSSKAQGAPSHKFSSTDIASLQEQQSLLQRERDDLARKISQLEQRVAANKK